MQSHNGIRYMTIPETEIDIDKFEHVHTEGNFVFGKYRGADTLVDRRKQVFCHFATCSTFYDDCGLYTETYKWRLVENEKRFEFCYYRTNGQVSKKHTFNKGTWFKTVKLGYVIQIYAQFPTYGYFGTEMSNTVKTSDKHEQATCSGYKPINDPEINIDKFKLTIIANDTVFGIYNNEHVSIDRRNSIFCIFVDVRVIQHPATFAHKFGKWYKVKQTGDFIVSVDQSHWLFSKNNGSMEIVKGSVVKFEKKENGNGFIMKIQIPNSVFNYFGTELFNKIEPVKEEPVTKEQTNSPSYTLSDMLTLPTTCDVVGVYGPNETTVFVKSSNSNVDHSYICDAKGNKWVLSNRNLKPVNRNDISLKPKERILTKEEAIQAGKESTFLLGISPFDSLLDLANVMSTESLFKRICKQVGLGYPTVPTEAFIRMAFDKLPYIYAYPAPKYFIEEASVTFLNGDKYTITSSPATGTIYKEFTPVKQEIKPTNNPQTK